MPYSTQGRKEIVEAVAIAALTALVTELLTPLAKLAAERLKARMEAPPAREDPTHG